MLTAEQNRRLTQTGPETPMANLLRWYWWPVGAIAELVKDPVQPIRLIWENLTLFRSERGELGLLAERCAHRGLSLAYGIPQPNGLRCAYHGWTYDTAGHCVDMPFEPACLPLRIKAYAVQELGWLDLGLPRARAGAAPATLGRVRARRHHLRHQLQAAPLQLGPVHG